MTVRRKFVAGNWKMNGLADSMSDFDAIATGVEGRRADHNGVDVVICPPATLLSAFAQRTPSAAVEIGGQDCHAAAKGAHTGDLSAEMLYDAGARYAIVGHSERRADHGESDAMVRAKVEAAWRANMTAILCVGETEAERDGGRAVETVVGQLAESAPDGTQGGWLVVAYEPVWAIGTGRTPSLEDIGEMHGALRAALTERFGAEGQAIRLLYGGSVKPGNAAEIFGVADVDGALVGGASLTADDFLPIVDAALEKAAAD